MGKIKVAQRRNVRRPRHREIKDAMRAELSLY